MAPARLAKNRRKVLIVSFAFPPADSVAAVRVGKFAKYLPQFGWEPIVLTADEIRGCSQTLPVEIDEVKIFRTSHFALGPTISRNLTGGQRTVHQPVPRISAWKTMLYKLIGLMEPIYTLPLLRILLLEPIGWYRPAVNEGLKIISRHKIDVIFSSHSPAISHFVASRLHKETGIRWVAEFRDLWSLNYYLRKIQPFYFLEQKIEKRVINGSNMLITVSEPMAKQLESLHGKKVVTIHNGFDDEDYVEDVSPTTKFTITYTGNIYRGKRDPTPLFKAIAELMGEGKISPSDLEVHFFGGNTLATLSPIVEACHIGEFVRIYGFVPFKESIKRQKESTVLLLLLWTDIREKGVYTGKLFEYLGARRPILAIGPKDGVVDELLAESGAGVMVSKVEEIKALLSSWLEQFEHSGIITSYYKPNDEVICQYTRKQQTAKLAHTLDEIAEPQSPKAKMAAPL